MAETAAANVLQQLDDLTECSIHRGTYENPRQLPCLHSFCLQCLVNCTKDKPLANNITCPLCRREITVPADGIEGFPRNFFIDKIIEIKRLTGPAQKDTLCDLCQEDEDLTSDVVPVASMFCAECRKNLCDRCTKEHRRHNKSHSVLEMGNGDINDELVKKLEVSFCNDHSSKAVEMFCFDCQAVICMMCFAEKHQLHKCSEINNSAKDFRKQMECEIDTISVCLSQGEKTKEMIDKNKDDFLQQIESVEKEIMERSDELRRIIDRDSSLLLDELKTIKSSHLKDLQIKDEELQRQLTITASLKAYGREIVKIGSASDICRSINQFRMRTKEVQATVDEAPFCEVVCRNVSFQSTEFQENLERNILGKLEVNSEKRMVKDISDPEKSLQKTLNVKSGKKDTSVNVASASGNKSEYDNESQGIQSSGATTTASYPPQQPTKERKSLHHISMELEDLATTDDIKEDDKTLTDDTTSEHQDIKGTSKLTIMKINAKDTMVGHDSMGISGKESNVKLDIREEGKVDDKYKEIGLDKAAIKFSKAEYNSEYDNKSQGTQSPGATTTTSYPPQQPTKQRKLMHYILMDEDAYKYIQRFLQQELEDLKALCNSVHELRDKASNFYLGYTVKYEVEDEIVRRRFQMLIDQVKVEEYKAPNMINASVLESLVYASAKSERIIICAQSEKNSLKIVGRPDKVDELKKRIEETVSKQLLSHEQLSKENMHPYYSEQPCKQQSGKNCYHQIPIDENLYTYISAHCQQEIERASTCCTSVASGQKGSTLTIDFELQDKRDIGFIRRIFEKLMGQFKVEKCRVPRGIDFAGLASVIQEMNTSQEVMIFRHEDKQLLKLIGPNTQVSKTKKWIEGLISDTIQSEQLSKQKPDVANSNVHSSPIMHQRIRQSRSLVTTSLQKSNPVDPPRKPGERFKITSTTSDSLTSESKRTKNKLTVRVHYANIVKQNTDVLVSCEDEWLQGFTGLAIALKEAAGSDVERELAVISKNRGPLEVGQVVHTSAGKLGPSVKYLVHAAKVKGSEHHPEDPKTFEILYKTFLNCFKYTNDKICQKSISIPPIGLHKYGVQMVSAAFFQAVEEYDTTAETRRSPLLPLRSIHFVDQDPSVVRQMIISIKSMIE